jgi:hypothetical protein
MGCGGISILLVIYFAKDIIYFLFIFCFSSVTGKRRGLTNPRHLCYGQEMRTNKPAAPLLWERYAKSRTDYMSKSLPNFTWQILCFANFQKDMPSKKRVHLQQSGIISLAKSKSNLHQES